MKPILERFSIDGRGTAVVVDGFADLPVSRPLSAVLRKPDGSQMTVVAHKEWLLRRSAPVDEREAFLLLGVEKSDLPEGTLIQITE